MALFRDIPQFTRSASYHVNVGLDYLVRHYTHYVTDYNLDVSPDFQRGNVWTETQKIRFIEYMLKGGLIGLDIYINCPTWRYSTRPDDSCVLVDGKQRLDAALGFINNEFKVFGEHYYRDFTDRPSTLVCNFRWHVNDLQTREEVLQWYLDLNSGGTVHTEEELTKVRELLANKIPYTQPPKEELAVQARLDREVIVKTLREEADEQAKRDEVNRQRDEEAAKPKKRGKKK